MSGDKFELLVILLAGSFILTIKAVTDQIVVDKVDPDIDQFNAECAQLTRINQTILEDARKGIFPPNNVQLKEHAYCFSKLVGFQNDRGYLYLNIIQKKLNNTLHNITAVDKIIYDCVWLSETPEDTAFDMLTCFHRKLPPGSIYVR